MRTTTLACAAFVLLLGGCGESDTDKAVASLTSIVEESDRGGQGDLTDEQADCVARGLVDEIGVEDLQDYGLLDEQLEPDGELAEVRMSSADSESAADVYTSCVDVEALLATATGAESELDPELRECLRLLDEDRVHDLLKAGFEQDRETSARLFAPVVTCTLEQQQEGSPSPR